MPCLVLPLMQVTEGVWMVFSSDVLKSRYPFICSNTMKLVSGKHRDNMATKDAVGNGSAAMKEAAMKPVDSAESNARRTARAGARREPCMLNGHNSIKVGLEHGSVGKETDEQAVRAGSNRQSQGVARPCRRRLPGMASSWRERAPPWIRQRVAPPELKAGSPIAAYGDGGVSRS